MIPNLGEEKVIESLINISETMGIILMLLPHIIIKGISA
jgi:hypothetical protein